MSDELEQQQVTATPPVRGSRWTFRRGDLADLANPDDAQQLRRVAKNLGCTVDELRAASKTITTEPAREAVSVAMTIWNGKSAPEQVRAQGSPSLWVPAHAGARRVAWKDAASLACAVLTLTPGTSQQQQAAGEALCLSSGADVAWTRRGVCYLLFTSEDDIPAHHKAAASCFALDRLDASPRVTAARIQTEFLPPGTSDVWSGHTPLGAAAWRACSPAAEQIDAEDHRVSELLTRLGLDTGAERFPHDLCPIQPSHISGRDPVVVLDRGVWCHSCDGRDGDGWRTWADLLAENSRGNLARLAHPWVDAARAWVHWEHARRTLPALTVDEQVAQWAYSGLLRATHGTLRREDQAAFCDLERATFNDKLLWVRGDSGRWLHSATLQPIELRDAELACMPWVRGRRELVALARSPFPLEGYTPVRPCGAVLNPASIPEGVVVLRPDPAGLKEPPAPLSPGLGFHNPEDAWRILEADFPKIDRTWIRLLIAAQACSEAGGQPVILVGFGDSGAGKTQTIKIAASITGSSAEDLSDAFAAEEEPWRRRVGEALTGGRRPLMINDVHRASRLHQKIKLLISLEDPVGYRPLFSSACSAPLRAPFVLTCVTYPDAFQAPEMARRLWVAPRLAGQVDWSTRPIFPARWRSTPTDDELLAETDPCEWDRVKAANTILQDVLVVCKQESFLWSRVAKIFGAFQGQNANPEQAEVDAGLMRRFFEHCCGRDGERRMSTHQRFPGSLGWVDLMSARALEILEPLLPDAGPNVDNRHLLSQTLMETDWSRLLSVSVRCVARTHHRAWVGRFEAPGPRGACPVNEQIILTPRTERGRSVRGVSISPVTDVS